MKRLPLAIPLLGAAALCSYAQISIVNGASFNAGQPIAPGAFAAIFGQNLCSQTVVADWVQPGQLPTTLGGCSVRVNGSAAMIQYVSLTQVNFVMPTGVAPGQANVVVSDGSQTVAGTMMAGVAGPGTFTLTAMGVGEGAMMNAASWRTGPFSTSTNAQPTYIAMYATGLDLSAKPTVMIGGIPVDVMWFGSVPGYPGLQQINMTLPNNVAGVGRAPVMITSAGQPGNVTYMHVLPTNQMMQGMPGWSAGMVVGENMTRGHEMSSMAYNGSNHTLLLADENDDVVRVISLDSNITSATITLPAGSQAHGVAVNASGKLAGVALSGKASVAIIDLVQNKVTSVIGTGYYPSHVAFAGSSLLSTNSASGTVSVIEPVGGAVTHTVSVARGASGIGIAGTTAVVANMQADSLSIIDLTTYAVSTVALPPGTRPHEVAVSSDGTKLVVTAPMSNTFFVVDLGNKSVTPISTASWNGMGPRAVVVNGTNVFIANQMTATLTVSDLSGNLVKTIPVDPGPVSVAIAPERSQLFVLAEGTGTIDVIDLGTYAISARLNAGETERQGQFAMPLISSLNPNSASPGSTFTLTISGADLGGVESVDFALPGASGMGGGMMGGGSGMTGGQSDTSIKVSNLQVNATGTQITASVQIASSAVSGTRQIRLQTGYAPVMGMMSNSLFSVK